MSVDLRDRLYAAIYNKHGGGSVSSQWTVNSILDAIIPIIEKAALAAQAPNPAHDAKAHLLAAFSEVLSYLESCEDGHWDNGTAPSKKMANRIAEAIRTIKAVVPPTAALKDLEVGDAGK